MLLLFEVVNNVVLSFLKEKEDREKGKGGRKGEGINRREMEENGKRVP